MVSPYGNWEIVNELVDLVVRYYTGNYTIFAFIICALFLISFIMRGMNFRYAIVFTLPIVAGFIALGYIQASWVMGVLVIIVGFFYARAIIKTMAS